MERRASRATIGAAVVSALLAPALQLVLARYSYVAGALAYLLVLPALGLALWIGLRLTRSEVGVRLGGADGYLVALLYPAAAMAVIAGAAWGAGALHVAHGFDGGRLGLRILALIGGNLLVGLITEEGLYRGVLWGAAQRAGWSPARIVAATSLAFVAWHVGVPFVDAHYAVPMANLPAYLTNAFLLGVAWALLRLKSGSILVPTLAHAVWNSLAYPLFGDGDAKGALGVADFGLFDPERGLAGIALNLAVAALLALWARRALRPTPPI
jgi:membrane protease YdiL (CAAX protease family)